MVSHGHADMVMDVMRDMAEAHSPVDEFIITLNLAGEDTKDLRALASSMPFKCTFIENSEKKGFGANHNQAFQRVAKGVAFAVLNPDLRWLRDGSGKLVDPLGKLAQALEAPNVGAAAPTVLSPRGKQEDSWRETLTPWRLFKRYAFRQRHAADNPDWASGLCLVFRQEAYATVGGFDEGYFMYCEDMDLCLRLRDTVWHTAFCWDVSVIHAAQRASRKSLTHLRWHVKSLLRFWWRRLIGLPPPSR